MKTTAQLGKELKATGAYGNPEGRKAIDEALPKMQEAETAGKKDEVNALRVALTKELERIYAALAPNLPPRNRRTSPGF